MKKNNLIALTIKRILWTACPLFSIACYSADEWPARVEMLDNGFLKDTFYKPSVEWKNTVDKISSTFNYSQKEKNIANASSIENVMINTNKEYSSIQKEQQPVIQQNNEKQPVFSEEPQHETVKPKNVSSFAPPEKLKEENKETVKKSTMPAFILTVGDSLMSEISQGLRGELDKKIKIKDIHKSSTGLTNLDYYDWPTTAHDAVVKTQPDWVIIHLGGNDGQDMKIGKQWIHVTDTSWQTEYYERATKLIKNIKTANPHVNIVWIGLPAMRDNKFARKIDIIRSVQKKAALDNHVIYIDTNNNNGLGETYQKQGKLDGKTVVLRRTDGIHYSREGGILIAQDIISQKNLKWK